MEAKVDLSKGSLAEHLTYLVELELCLRWLVILLETVRDQLLDEEDLLRPG